MTLQVDTSIAAVNSATATATTAAFNAPANSLICAMITLDGVFSHTVTAAMSDTAGLSWTLQARANSNGSSNGGSAEIWTAPSVAGFTGQTVTATNSESNTASDATELRVVVFTDTNGGIPTVAAVAAAADFNTATTTHTTTLTTTADNSWTWWKDLNYTRTATLTASGGNAILAQGGDADGDNFATGAQSSTSTAPTASSGTGLTLGGTFAATAQGHIVAVEILPGAGGGPPPLPFNPGQTWRRRFKHPQRLPLQPPDTPAVTPPPIVVTGPTSPPLSAVATVKRATLQDDPVLTTAPPLVVTGKTPVPAGVTSLARSSLIDLATAPPIVVNPQPSNARPGVITVQRGTLQDDPVLTTKPPVVTVGQTPLPAGQLAFTARSSLADPATTQATPGPIVVVGQTPPPIQVSQAFTSLGAGVEDAPRPVTPVVVTGQTPLPAGGQAYLSRSSLADVVSAPGPITFPIVVTGATPRPAGSASSLRSTLADPPVLTTPGPIVITGSTPVPLNTPQPYMARSSFIDVAVPVGTPSPIVVASQVKQAAKSPVLISRGSLADDPVLTTKPPIVVAAPYLRIPRATFCYALPASGIGVPFSTTLTGNVHGPDAMITAGLAGTASGAILGDMHGATSSGESGTIS